MRKFRIRPVGEEEIADYRNVQDAVMPTLGLVETLKAETGKEYEQFGTSDSAMVNGHWTFVGEHEYVAYRTDDLGICAAPDSTDPIDVRRNYERTLPKAERRQIQIERMFAIS